MAFKGLSVSNTAIEYRDDTTAKLVRADVDGVKGSVDLAAKLQGKLGKSVSKPVEFHKDPGGNVWVCVGEPEDWARVDAEYAKAQETKD